MLGEVRITPSILNADKSRLQSEIAKITEAAMRGELDFEASLRARVALLKGLPETVLRGARRV